MPPYVKAAHITNYAIWILHVNHTVHQLLQRDMVIRYKATPILKTTMHFFIQYVHVLHNLISRQQTFFLHVLFFIG